MFIQEGYIDLGKASKLYNRCKTTLRGMCFDLL